jgi:S1-C subfamily serine protease
MLLRRQLPYCLASLVLLLLLSPAVAMATYDAVVRVTANVPAEARTAASLGTERAGNGILIDREGHVLTIGYLILEAVRIEVTTADGKAYPARFVGYDHATGFGLLQTAPPIPASPLELGDSEGVALGDPVQVLTAGELAGLNARVISRKEFAGYWEYLLESALYVTPPHPDYGGAALVAADGRLVGVGSILTRMDLEGVGYIPCNMFVPIDLLKPILADLIEHGRATTSPQPWLGMHSEEVQGRVFVLRVSEGGPAEAAGLEAGDMILAVGGEAVSGLADFYRKLWSLGEAGTAIPLRVLHKDEVQEVTVTSQDRHGYLRPAGSMMGEPI